MKLKDRYYSIERVETDGNTVVFHFRFLPECDVFRGHFPGNPVCPGACNIETVRECASSIAGKELRIRAIKRCRMTAVATPCGCGEMELRVCVSPTDDGFAVTATMADASKSYMEFKGTMAETL